MKVRQKRGNFPVYAATAMAAACHLIGVPAKAQTSSRSVEVKATPAAAVPAAPSGVRASNPPGNNDVENLEVSWAPVAGATSYNIYRSTVTGGEGTVPFQTGVLAPNWGDYAVTGGVTYFYKVAAVNGKGASALSAEVSATPPNLGGGGGGGGGGSATAGVQIVNNNTTQTQENLNLTTSGTITSMTVTITVPKSSGSATFGGQYSTAPNFNSSWTDNGTSLVFTYTLQSGQQLQSGQYTFDAQVNTSSQHNVGLDTYQVTYSGGTLNGNM